MDFDLIETPENVELEQRLAGIGTRFMAGFVDSALIVGAVLMLLLVLMLIDVARVMSPLQEAVGETWVIVIVAFAMFVLLWGYFALFELYRNGQTPGKRYMKIRVVKEGGGAIGFSEVAIRNLLRPIDGLPFYPIAGIAMFFTRKSQRLGDLAAGTVVISEAQQDYSAKADRPSTVEWSRPLSAESLRRTSLNPDELRVLSSYQSRRDELSPDARERLLGRLVPPILERLGRPLESASLDWLENQVDMLLAGDDPAAEADAGEVPS
jgi:uncharacterized RDD family membrane protein YckC